MKVFHDAWYTLFDRSFNPKKYLYHFTSIESATKILHGGTLKFSKVSRANDTLESKPRISFENGKEEEVQNAIRHFREINNKFLQILCFSMDKNVPSEESGVSLVSTEDRIMNFSGRGFALPRMWAQYAGNNKGICLVFNKDRIIEAIEKEVGGSLLMYGPVEYLDYFERRDTECGDIVDLINKKSRTQNAVQQSLRDIDFFKRHMDFVEYNYFCKLSDWENENEYRFVAYGEDDYFVENIYSALTGVVVGENIEPETERIIRLFCDGKCEVKKISFSYAGCQLRAIKK